MRANDFALFVLLPKELFFSTQYTLVFHFHESQYFKGAVPCEIYDESANSNYID